jgi:hypothetical protein
MPKSEADRANIIATRYKDRIEATRSSIGASRLLAKNDKKGHMAYVHLS